MKTTLYVVACLCGLAFLGSTFESLRLVVTSVQALHEAEAAPGVGESMGAGLGGAFLYMAALPWAIMALISLMATLVAAIGGRLIDLGEQRLKSEGAQARALASLGKLAQSHEEKLAYACKRLHAMQMIAQRERVGSTD